MSKLVNVDVVIDEIEKHKQYMRDKVIDEKLAELYFLAHEHIKELILLKVPSAEEESFEWCDTCKEYDQEAHCCHRWSKMIRKTIEEMKVVRCKDCIYADYMDDIKTFWCTECGQGRTVAPNDFCSYAERREVTT